jgi:hypothetical protein
MLTGLGLNQGVGLSNTQIRENSQQILPGAAQVALDYIQMPPGSNIVPKRSSMEGAYTRTLPDWAAEWLTGRRSLVEADSTGVTKVIKERQKTNEDFANQCYDIIVDHLTGAQHIPGSSPDAAYAALARMHVPEEEQMSSVLKRIEGVNMDDRMKEALQAGVKGAKARELRQSMTPNPWSNL